MKTLKFISLASLGALATTIVIALASCSGKEKSAENPDSTTDPLAENVETTETSATADNGDAVIVLEEGATITPVAGKGVVIDFNATWCPPCKQFAPHFHAVAAENTDKALFYSVDVDVHPDLATEYEVEAIPTVIYIAPDGTVNRTVGYLEQQQFAELVNQYIK